MEKFFIYLIFISLFLVSCNHTGHEHEGHQHEERAHHDEDSHEGCKHNNKEEYRTGGEHAGEITFDKAQAKAAGLDIQTATPGTFSRIIKTSGQLLSAQGDEVMLVAASGGVVSFAHAPVSEGATVKKGQVIVSISARDMVDGDPAIKAKVEYETAQKDYERAESLVKEKIISRKDFEQAQLRYETAQTAYNIHAKNVTSKGMNMTANIDGTIKRRLVNEGEYVTVGQPIMSLSKNKRLQLRAEVPAKYFRSLEGVKDANFKVPYDDVTYKLSDLHGRLLSIGASVEENSFYLPVIFEFDNTGAFIAGSFAEIYLLTEVLHDVITIPLTAVTEEQGLYFVYLQLDEETYKKQEVTLGPDDGKRIQVISGLTEGDKVVTQGAIQVKLAAHSTIIPEGHTH